MAATTSDALARLEAHVAQHRVDRGFRYRGTMFDGCVGFDSDSDSNAEPESPSVLARSCSAFSRAAVVAKLGGDVANLARVFERTHSPGRASGDSFYTKTAPRQMNELFDASLDVGLTVGESAVAVTWAFRSEWLWISECFHDAHLSESFTQTIAIGECLICRFQSFEKPDHAAFGGGELHQAELEVMWDEVERVRLLLECESAMGVLLWLCCLGTHVGTNGVNRKVLVDVVLEYWGVIEESSRNRINLVVLKDKNGYPEVKVTGMFGMEEENFSNDVEHTTEVPANRRMRTLEENVNHAMGLSEEGRMRVEEEENFFHNQHARHHEWSDSDECYNDSDSDYSD
ncbi:hypothetical protein HDU79_006488 [Rhizoclosmatium sp. JEL0117]|nr:hypothetical protein HDU79_006488 [Rhizoclosmatium sp. JEL0117]